MNVTIQFIRDDGSRVNVVTSFPGMPSPGDRVQFQDADRDEYLDGRVLYVRWSDIDGAVLVNIYTEKW